MNHIILDRQIFPDKLGRIGIVGNDAAHFGGGKEYVRRAFSLKKPPGGSRISQVQIRMATRDDIGVSASRQGPAKRGACQATMPCDVNLRSFIHAKPLLATTKGLKAVLAHQLVAFGERQILARHFRHQF